MLSFRHTKQTSKNAVDTTFNSKKSNTTVNSQIERTWKNEKVYDEINYIGRPCLSLTWVMKEKIINRKKIIKLIF